MTCTAARHRRQPGQYENDASVDGTSPTGHRPGLGRVALLRRGARGRRSRSRRTATRRRHAAGPAARGRRPGDVGLQGHEHRQRRLVNWQPTDDKGVSPACPQLLLLRSGRDGPLLRRPGPPGRPVHEHRRRARGNAADPAGPPVTASDPANYFGVAGRDRPREARPTDRTPTWRPGRSSPSAGPSPGPTG